MDVRRLFICVSPTPACNIPACIMEVYQYVKISIIKTPCAFFPFLLFVFLKFISIFSMPLSNLGFSSILENCFDDFSSLCKEDNATHRTSFPINLSHICNMQVSLIRLSRDVSIPEKMFQSFSFLAILVD